MLPGGARSPSRVTAAPNAGYAFVAAFFEELARCGVEHVCISPGSRSTPLAVEAIRQPGMHAWSHIDERSSSFFALGLAKATRSPVALVATSGTAIANFLPAVVEAHYARVPLIVLSADRPPELRECGAGQAIDQLKIFGSHVGFFAELAPAESSANPLRYARTIACRAIAEATGGASGPVHLNWPLREPLAPIESKPALAADDELARIGRAVTDGESWARPYTGIERGVASPVDAQIRALVDRIRSCRRGVIACGPIDDGPALCDAVVRLAKLSGWPILADPTSQLRSGPRVAGAPILASADWLLRSQAWSNAFAPECVLRIGGPLVSKAFRLWLEAQRPSDLLLVDRDGVWSEPSQLASEIWIVDPGELCARVCDVLEEEEVKPLEGAWLNGFCTAERRAQRVIEKHLDQTEALLELRATRELCANLPEGAVLYVSNSMPVRNLDAVMPVAAKNVRVLCNRGANGIDGMTSSALGAAAADRGHVVLLTGDLAFLHDVGGLLTAHRYPLRATIVVLNNDGGGIFSFLPVAQFGEEVGFDEFFRTPHGLDLEAASRLYGHAFTRVTSWDTYREALRSSFRYEGLSIIEVPIDPEANLADFRSIESEIDDAICAQDVK